jgi:hypothetical protein
MEKLSSLALRISRRLLFIILVLGFFKALKLVPSVPDPRPYEEYDFVEDCINVITPYIGPEFCDD